MFAVDDAAAEAIRRAYKEGGELSGVAELRRYFPLVQDNDQARMCVRMIAKTDIGTCIAALDPYTPWEAYAELGVQRRLINYEGPLTLAKWR